MKEIYTYSEEDTERLGEKIGKLAFAGMIILLKGDLGTGKTVLTRGIARGLGIEDPITSPTYTLIHQYYGRLPLYHFDIYRLGDAEEMYDLGYEEFFYGQGVSVVEWPERMEDLGPDEYLKIIIEKPFSCGEQEDHGHNDKEGNKGNTGNEGKEGNTGNEAKEGNEANEENRKQGEGSMVAGDKRVIRIIPVGEVYDKMAKDLINI